MSGIASMLAKRLPPPGALGADAGPPPPKAGPPGDAEPDEGADAAGESATADFLAASKSGDAAGAWAAFKEMCSLHSDAEPDDGGY